MRAGSNDYHADLIREQERMRGEEKRGEPRGRRNYNSSGEFPKGFIDGGVAPAHVHTHTRGSQPQNGTASDQRTIADLFRKIKAVRSCEITYFKTKFL